MVIGHVGPILCLDSELKNKPIARKSIVAARNIVKAEVFTEENLTVKGSATGISPMACELIGKVVKMDYKIDPIKMWRADHENSCR